MKQITNATSNTSVTFAPTTNPTSRTMVIGGVQPVAEQSATLESIQEPPAEKKRQKIRDFYNVSDLVKYLKDYNIHASDSWIKRNFYVSLDSQEQNGNSYLKDKLSAFSPHVIDQIIKMANFWKPYISDESYEKLVLYIVETFSTLNTCEVGSYPSLENTYILSIDNMVQISPLPLDTMTLIKSNGDIYISKGKGSKLIPLK